MQSAFVFFDLETTPPYRGRRQLMQLAAIAVSSSFASLESIELKVRFDDSRTPRDGLRKRRYSRHSWEQTAVEPFQAARTFARFLQRHRPGRSLVQLIAHHAAFDAPLLQCWYQDLDLFLPARFDVLCTLQRARWYFAERPYLAPPLNYQLATLCNYFEVPFHAARAHDALGDVTATVGLYRALSAHNKATAYRRSA